MASKAPVSMAYKDDVMQNITNEFKQIQECIGMYISTKGKEGAFHLYKEIFNNALDECANELSPANTIVTDLYEENGMIVVSDNGRGIPFDDMVSSCSKKHTSTKFANNRSSNKYSAGMNGVGLVVTTALSDVMIMTSKREFADKTSKEKTISFVACELTEEKPKECKKNSHGTTVRFIPSKKYLGNFKIDADDIITWLRHMSYIIPKGIKLEFNFIPKNKDSKFKTRTFEAVGLAENVDFLSTNPEFDPIFVKDATDTMEVEFAFTYDKTIDERVIDSYCNYVITKDGGYHEDACISAVTDFMVKAARKADPDAKYEVIRSDVSKGLICAINVRVMNVVLEGQHKSKVGSKEVFDYVKPTIVSKLEKFFSNNQTLLAKIVAYLRQIAKIRVDAYAVKGIKPPKQMSLYDEADIKKYTPISERNKKDYCELIITEGDSASGAIKQTRHPFYQAVYTTGGVFTNVMEMSLQEISKKAVPSELIRILGCGIGPQFNINNLRWNKVILAMDADPDGNFIKSLTSAFIIITMPGLIEDGRLYSARPPLYTISNKSIKKYKPAKPYLYDKREYTAFENSIIAKNVDMAINGSILSTQGKIEWLNTNATYIDELKHLENATACDPTILEYVCATMLCLPTSYNSKYKLVLGDTEKNKKILPKLYKELFPEMHYDEDKHSLFGVYNNKRYSLIMDNAFISAASGFLKVLANNDCVEVEYKNKHDADAKPEFATIGQFLRAVRSEYNVDVSDRFKGLGEIDPQLLFTATINPKTRKLVRLTMEDRDRVIKSMLDLHGMKNVDVRKAMLLNADIDKDDIDT
jgi:DNA gyrase/topoisomerase IV subunit B